MLKEREIVESNFDGMMAAFVEPAFNNEASKYMAEHLEEIRRQVLRMGVHIDVVDDLISDVWISICEAEQRGEGYNISHANEGDIITVQEFIFGRIRGYKMNARYRNDGTERHISKDKSKCIEIASASCADASDLDNLDGIQKAYAMAASYDEIEDIDASISLRSNIEFCIGYNDQIGFNIMNLFKNMDIVAGVEFNTGLFDMLKSTMNRHSDFRDAFKEVMLIAVRHRPIFESVVSAM